MRAFHRAILALIIVISLPAAARAEVEERATEVLSGWYGLVLQLVRHTPTYSPPAASRSFAYLGVGVHEALASGRPELRSLAGQLNDFEAPPAREPGLAYDEAVILHTLLSAGVREFFGNTGPSGQRAISVGEDVFGERAHHGVAEEVARRSERYGAALAEHVSVWSQGDGGAVVANMGFPLEYAVAGGPSNWVPTSLIQQQQAPLLPQWGDNRAFAMPHGAACPLPPPPAYSDEAGSKFHAEALEVYETVYSLSQEQLAIARFWSDDPMLSPTPPGHWISIALQVFDAHETELHRRVDVLARLGVTLADSFIGCWYSKYEYDLLRPVTYIHRLIDPTWQPPLITPPFPEYPSGHSTQSGAAAMVLSAAFGEDFAFTDATHVGDGMPARDYASFWKAAEEAGISRLYGGIHFRAAIERGLDQGRCIGAHAVALVTQN